MQVRIRKGKKEDLEPLGIILHTSLPKDFKRLQDAESCLKLWLRKPEYMIIAEHNKYPIGVLLPSSEISPVIDKKIGILC